MRTENSDTIAFGCLAVFFPIFILLINIAFVAGLVWAVVWVLQHTGVI